MSLRRKLTPYVFLAPAIVLIGTFVLLPMISALIMSFTEYNMIDEARFVGTFQYKKLGAVLDNEFYLGQPQNLFLRRHDTPAIWRGSTLCEYNVPLRTGLVLHF